LDMRGAQRSFQIARMSHSLGTGAHRPGSLTSSQEKGKSMVFRARALSLLLGGALLITAVIQVPANGATKSRRDAVGDAPATIDLTRLTARNGDVRITMTLKVRDLRRTGRFDMEYYRFFIPGSDFGFEGGEVVVRRLADGTVRARYYWIFGDEFTERRPCPGLHVRWNARENFIRAKIPQSCWTAHPVPPRWTFFASSDQRRSFDAVPELTVRRG